MIDENRIHVLFQPRKTISLLSVVAGQYNLIEVETQEQTIPVFKVTPFDNYVAINKTHDIALVEVRDPSDNTFIAIKSIA